MLGNKWHTGYTASPTKSPFQPVRVFEVFNSWIPDHCPSVQLPLSADDIQSKNKNHPTNNKQIHKGFFSLKKKKGGETYLHFYCLQEDFSFVFWKNHDTYQQK